VLTRRRFTKMPSGVLISGGSLTYQSLALVQAEPFIAVVITVEKRLEARLGVAVMDA
jgi:hypothetical protein